MSKRFSLSIWAVILAFFGCQTNNPTPQTGNGVPNNTFLLAGSAGKTWKTHDMLDNQTGSYLSYKHTIDSCSHDDLWEFTPDLNCRQNSGPVVCQGSNAGYYNVSKWKLKGNDSLITTMFFVNLVSSYKIVRLTSDTLVLQDDILVWGSDTIRRRLVYLKQ